MFFSYVIFAQLESCDWLLTRRSLVVGLRLSGGHSLHETSSVIVETVTKTSKMAGAYSSLSSSQSTSDASKVVCHGAGLSKAFVGQKNNFSVDCGKAGKIKQKLSQ